MVTDYCRGGELFFHLKKSVEQGVAGSPITIGVEQWCSRTVVPLFSHPTIAPQAADIY